MQVGSYFQQQGSEVFLLGAWEPLNSFSAGCLGYLVIRRVTHKDQCWGLEGSPRGTLTFCSHPAVPGDRLQWVCSKLFQIAKDTAHARARAGSLRPGIIATGPVSGRLLCHREIQEEGNATGQERISEIFQFPLLMLPLFLKQCLTRCLYSLHFHASFDGASLLPGGITPSFHLWPLPLKNTHLCSRVKIHLSLTSKYWGHREFI